MFLKACVRRLSGTHVRADLTVVVAPLPIPWCVASLWKSLNLRPARLGREAVGNGKVRTLRAATVLVSSVLAHQPGAGLPARVDTQEVCFTFGHLKWWTSCNP